MGVYVESPVFVFLSITVSPPLFAALTIFQFTPSALPIDWLPLSHVTFPVLW